MLPILLTILKIAGLAVLALLGLAAAVLLIILLVPVRYSLSGSFCRSLRAKAKVTWLLHAVSVTVTYDDKPDIAIRLLGKRLFQGKDREDEPEDSRDGSEEERREPEDGRDGPEEERREPEDVWDGPEEERQEAEDVWGGPEEERREPADRRKGPGRGKAREKKTLEAAENGTRPGGRRAKPEEESAESPGGTGRLRQTIDSVKEKWNQLSDYKEKISGFVQDPENQKTGKLIFRQIKKMIRHVLPVKAEGKAVFGFDDPALTGKVLSGLSILYAWYGDKIEIVPMFDQKILEAEGSLRGRIRMGTMLALGLRVFLNKNFRRLLRRFIRSGGK